MPTRRDRRPEALILDPGVLADGPVCELGAHLAVERHGGVAVEPWRDRFQEAVLREIAVVADAAEVPDASQLQAVVQLQKSRAATFEDLRHAWRILEPGGRLLLAGPNTLGIVSAVRRLAEQLDQPGVVVANRARARVVRFQRDAGPGPRAEPGGEIRVELPAPPETANASKREDAMVSRVLTLETAPGVFSAKKLDEGSALLIRMLRDWQGPKPPRRVVDLGCGAGALGLAAATIWPGTRVLLVDADARAVRCARRNVERLGLGDRCQVQWWDAREEPLEHGFDVALVNPPFHHRGAEVDLAPAAALFESLAGWLAPKGRALLVANRTLPYERPLATLGAIEEVGQTRGYKLLSLQRSSRSREARGRIAPGSRSSGSSSPPIRSR